MNLRRPLRTDLDTFGPRVQRRVLRWWRRQSPAGQDRYATLAPLTSVLLFLVAMILAFWYLRNEEFEREREAVKRDTEIAQLQIRSRLIDNEEQLARLAREIAQHSTEPVSFATQATAFTRDRPEVVRLFWLGPDRSLRSTSQDDRLLAPARVTPPLTSAPDTSLPVDGVPSEPEWAFTTARDLRQSVYSRAFTGPSGQSVFQVQFPLLDRGDFVGTLVAEYSVENLLRFFVPAEVANRHPVALLDGRERILASTVTAMPGKKQPRGAIVSELPLAPAGNGLVLRSTGYRTSLGLIGNTLFWIVAGLSALTVWMLMGTWRHVRRRAQMQRTLETETNFRRAMENSMLTGMRAMDLEGRVTYVNPAFCAMTGYAEAELVDTLPPFPYWPPDRIDEISRLFQQELEGRSPAGGIEVRVMRKDGSVFDSRMYVSPLIDPRGVQTGWMTSMTNITEAKRIRDQLSAAHERFTTVLESLDASVSVLSVLQNELLFANRSYRVWFGSEAGGHEQLWGREPGIVPLPDADDSVENLGGLPTNELTEAGAEPREAYIESLGKWFDVRARYLQWTDGRLAQMIIATDITVRRRAELASAQQAEKAQMTSRLVTMGEMASSVAHELNQPLTAISNYCNGMVSRVEGGTIERADLVAALQKTARQAQRAGQIIHRIRAFVKRSEPQRQPADARAIVEDAVDLAGIELRRRHVSIQTYLAQRLPQVLCDPILIEQVLLNLLKNAAEAIDNAELPRERRSIELRVVPRHTSDEGDVIEFTVSDTGPGLQPEALARLYEAFFSTKADGMGIGLSLCRSIIESHRGRMKAENSYNGDVVTGCNFTFTLPVDSGRDDAPTEPSAPGGTPARIAAPPASHPAVTP